MGNKYWEKGLELMQSRRRWELHREGLLPPSLPCNPIIFYANNQKNAIIRGCNLLRYEAYEKGGADEATLINHKCEGCDISIHLQLFDNICIYVELYSYDEATNEEEDEEFYMMWNGKTWEREEIGDDVDIDWTKSVFWPKGEKKQSDFYPNADEDGMVDVSDYPYTK